VKDFELKAQFAHIISNPSIGNNFKFNLIIYLN